MRLSSILILCLLTGAARAHEKHISTLTVTDGPASGTVRVAVAVHLPDYQTCSKAGKDGFEKWVNEQIRLTSGEAHPQMKMDSLSWGHDIRGVFTAPVSDSPTLTVYCRMFSACFPGQKTIVAAQLGGQNFGRVLTPQQDTCVFQTGK